MTEDNYHAYCDESGNTGANLLDPRQPLFVVGGWLVNDRALPAAQDRVREYADILSLTEKELHGYQLLKSERGRRAIYLLMTDFLNPFSLPICQIIEKRFMLAGMVYETFLDPDSNPKIPESFVDMWEGKHDLGEKIYALPDKVLARFSKAYETLDRSLLLKSLRSVADALQARSETHLADLILGSFPHIEKIIEKQRIGRKSYDSLTLNTPNVAAFHMFFHSLEKIGRDSAIPKITLVHDENLQFRKTFPMIFEGFRDDISNKVIKMGPWSDVYFGFQSLKDFEFADSKNEPILQASDVFVSSIYLYAANACRGRNSPRSLKEICRLFLKEDDSHPAMIRYISSNSLEDKIRSSFQ